MSSRDDQREIERIMAEAGLAIARIDRSGAVFATTPAMQGVLKRGTLFIVREATLQGASSVIQDAFETLLHEERRPRTVRVVDREARAWRLTVVPNSTHDPFGAHRPRYSLIVRRIDEETDAESYLRARYKLTPAECRCALLLPEAGDAKALAERLDVAWETVRSQLRTVFEKTGVQSQSELVRLLAREGLIQAG